MPKANKPDREHRFHPDRKWRLDFAWVKQKVAVEIEGGHYVQGRHNRPVGYQNDMEKYNEAQVIGWVVLRFSYEDLEKRPEYVTDQINRAMSLAVVSGVELPE